MTERVTLEECCKALRSIIGNLAESDFSLSQGYLAIQALQDFGVDMAVNMYDEINGFPPDPLSFEAPVLKEDWFNG